MPVSCLVMVFREATGHWTETLFYPWLLLLETKWDSQRTQWRRQVSWRQSCDRSQLSLAPLVGNFTARHFLHLHPWSPSSLLQAPFPLPCAHSVVTTSSSPLTGVWTLPSGAPFSSCTTHLSLIPLPKPASGSHLRVLGSNEHVHHHWYPSMGVSKIYPVPF